MPAVWKETFHHDNEAPHKDFENGIQSVPSTTPKFASVGFRDGSEQIPLGLRPLSQDVVGDALNGFCFSDKELHHQTHPVQGIYLQAH